MKGSIHNFKESAEKLRTDLEEALIDMYAQLHIFQQTQLQSRINIVKCNQSSHSSIQSGKG
jgi:hypothetical protein